MLYFADKGLKFGITHADWLFCFAMCVPALTPGHWGMWVAS